MPEDKTPIELAVSLRVYFDAKLEALEKSQELARQVIERRLDGLNQLREVLRDQQQKFATCSELDALRERLDSEAKRFDKDIQALREFRATLEGKASQQSVIFAYILSIIGLLLGIVGIFRK